MLNLVTVVGENTHILPHMLQHYEDKVDRVYVGVYRQSENDNILDEIQSMGITPYLVHTDSKYNWQKVTEIYNTIKETKPNDWWIVSDDDELQVYPYDLEDIIRHCEKNNYEYVTGGFLDRIGVNGTFPTVDRETELHKTFPLAGFFRYPMSGACPSKVTLMKGSTRVSTGQHYIQVAEGCERPKWVPREEIFTQVHHFKWDSTCVDRIKRVADVNKQYAYSQEYHKMYDAIKSSDWKIDISNPDYYIEELKELSYINYNDYPYWNDLRDVISTIWPYG